MNWVFLSPPQAYWLAVVTLCGPPANALQRSPQPSALSPALADAWHILPACPLPRCCGTLASRRQIFSRSSGCATPTQLVLCGLQILCCAACRTCAALHAEAAGAAGLQMFCCAAGHRTCMPCAKRSASCKRLLASDCTIMSQHAMPCYSSAAPFHFAVCCLARCRDQQGREGGPAARAAALRHLSRTG